MGDVSKPISETSVLMTLGKPRLVELARELGASVADGATKEAMVSRLLGGAPLDFPHLMRLLGRDELRAACRAHGLDDSGRARGELAGRLVAAWRPEVAAGRPSRIPGPARPLGTPEVGNIVHARHRQYLVTAVVPPVKPGDQTRVTMACLDDDAPGRELEVLWELELGAQVVAPETSGLGAISRVDPPRHFAAYLHALKWNSVTATDARLFQAPFRAGIRLMNHQLTPLKRALEMPRANLFIADDVGLGKTIEAGLVLQELLLRQRVDWVLVVAPAAVALQWRDEMYQRFGLRFEVYNREFVARRRQERGFAVNPWSTHNRFIISYQTLRRPEYRDGLIAQIGDRLKKSLLIVDEAHSIAPATASKYAMDTRQTEMMREVARRFENRLFLSATPHNGHSNSFSALLHILDERRFTRGVKVRPQQLQAVMVRRLKEDLRALGTEQLPKRNVVRVELSHEGGAWMQSVGGSGKVEPLGAGDNPELQLAEMLAEYTRLACPPKGAGKLVFINLQKRLLSSVEAFHRTLARHAKAVKNRQAATAAEIPESPDADEYGVDDDVQEEMFGAEIEARSRQLGELNARASELLEKMLALSEQHRSAPDAKVRALLDWVRKNQCSGVEFGGGKRGSKWTERRLIIFTEYGHTKDYLRGILTQAVTDTDQGEARIMQFHGGMRDEVSKDSRATSREEVKAAFNASPEAHPVRILIATDAAREGVNLQAHCADLFHFDVPWNPARMEQRNGRIDRTLQPKAEVNCAYFVYTQREEDRVLQTLIEKVRRIQRELGSLGEVVMERLGDAMERSGITAETMSLLEKAEQIGDAGRTTTEELESQRLEGQKLRAEIDDAGSILNASAKVMDFDPALLKDAIDVGCELAGAANLAPGPALKDEPGLPSFVLPELPDSWQASLDTLRTARRRGQEFWEWRRQAPMPVVFKPPSRMSPDAVHLHLQHPFVQRIMSRFRSQGFSAHDLSRLTVVRNPGDALIRVIAFARLSLFGPGATRLHDQLISVAAQWLEAGGPKHLKPFAEEADRRALESLERLLKESPTLDGVNEKIQRRVVETAPADLATLWPHLHAEADAREHDVRRMLAGRARDEGDALRKILEEQRKDIQSKLGEQLTLFGEKEHEQKRQWEDDRRHMTDRLSGIDREIETEPAQVAELYKVVLRRVEPVGLVYLWPATR